MKYRLCSILLISMYILGCNKVLFDTPMPLGSNQLYSIPKSLYGNYIEVGHNQNSVFGLFYSVYIDENEILQIEVSEANYLDSIKWASLKMEPIVQIKVQDGQLQIITETTLHEIPFSDSISSQPSHPAYTLDLKNGLFYDSFEEGREGVCFKLLQKNGAYYLNTEEWPNYWLPLKIQKKNNNIIFQSMSFSNFYGLDSSFFDLKKRYGLKKINMGPGKHLWHAHQATSNDVLLNKLFKENLFDTRIWYKTESGSNRNYLVLFYLFFGLIFFYSLWKLLQR